VAVPPAGTVTTRLSRITWRAPSQTVWSTRTAVSAAESLRRPVVAPKVRSVTEVVTAVPATETGLRASSQTSCQMPAASWPHQEPAGWW
jgi:hypothetical protein